MLPAIGFLLVLFLRYALGFSIPFTVVANNQSGFDPNVIQNNDGFGRSIATLGDFNNDGTIDFVVGAYQDDSLGSNSDNGAIYMILMNPNMTVLNVQKISPVDGNGGILGITNGDLFGRSLAVLGDMNGDMIPDIAVGAPRGGVSPVSLPGRVLILFMNADLTVNSFQPIGDNIGGFPSGLLEVEDRFGRGVTCLGNLGGSATPDIAVSARGDDDGQVDAGAVYILFLTSAGTVESTVKLSAATNMFLAAELGPFDQFGDSIASIGMLGGFPALAVAAGEDDDGGVGGSADIGAVYIIFLNTDGTIRNSPPPQKISATRGGFGGLLQDGNVFGKSIGLAGDLDGDGTPEIIVGAPQDGDGGIANTGALWVLFLNPNGTVRDYQKISDTEGGFQFPLQSNDRMGVSVATSGDFDGDGRIDVAFGAYRTFMNTGAFFVMPLIFCGDSTFDSLAEACDDGNTIGNDGCTSLCSVELGYSCIGSPSICTEVCGDGLIVGNEECDDNNGLSLDGCDSNCQFEAGWICSGLPSNCLETCGDGLVVGREPCDDNNTNGGDGCGPDCSLEFGFLCVGTPSDCSPRCGDGAIVGGEVCDDGNALDGDGCGADCQEETGFTCNICDPVCGDGIQVGGEACDDGNALDGDGCSSTCSLESNALTMAQISGIAVGSFGFLCILLCAIAICGLAILRSNKKRSHVEIQLPGEFIITNVTLGAVIGSGEFGEVYKGTWNNLEIAAKSIKSDNLSEFKNELDVMVGLRHPNILQFFGVYYAEEKDNTPMIVTEFMNKGDLLGLLQKEAEITTRNLAEFCHQISLGMEYLHDSKILHRDLACRNILVSGKIENLTAKVADFGLSRHTSDYYKLSSKKIPVRWTAPEVIEFGKASKASDVWSFGIVVWEIFSRGSIPYAGITNREVIEKVRAGFRLTPSTVTPTTVARIMTQCWKKDETARPPFTEITKTLENLSDEDFEAKSVMMNQARSEINPDDAMEYREKFEKIKKENERLKSTTGREISMLREKNTRLKNMLRDLDIHVSEDEDRSKKRIYQAPYEDVDESHDLYGRTPSPRGSSAPPATTEKQEEYTEDSVYDHTPSQTKPEETESVYSRSPSLSTPNNGANVLPKLNLYTSPEDD